MDFLMESGFMHWMSERMSFTNWVKADFYETFLITLKFSATPRLRERYRLGEGSSRYGNCFSRLNEPSCTARRETVSDARGVLKRFLGESRHGSAWPVAATGLGADWRKRARSRARRDSDRHGKGRA